MRCHPVLQPQSGHLVVVGLFHSSRVGLHQVEWRLAHAMGYLFSHQVGPCYGSLVLTPSAMPRDGDSVKESL